MATIWHWQEKTVKISLGVVRRRFKIFFLFFFCAATCCAETIARLAGCCNNSRAVCQTSPRFAELETCFNVTRKKKKKITREPAQNKNKFALQLFVRLFTLSLSPMSAPARTRTYRLVVVICLILLLYCTAPAWHERPPSQRWNFVFFCYSPFSFYYFSLLQILCIHILLNRGKQRVYLHTVYWIEFEKISIEHFLIVMYNKICQSRRPELGFRVQVLLLRKQTSGGPRRCNGRRDFVHHLPLGAACYIPFHFFHHHLLLLLLLDDEIIIACASVCLCSATVHTQR